MSDLLRTRDSTRLLAIGLGASVALLGATTIFFWNPAPDVAHTPDELEAEDSVEPAILRLPQKSDYVEVNARPLFRPLRKPEAAKSEAVVASEADAAAAAAKSGPATLDLSLVAVISSPELELAVVTEAEEDRSYHLEEGERINGWRLSKIFPNRVVFVHGGNLKEVFMSDHSVEGIIYVESDVDRKPCIEGISCEN